MTSTSTAELPSFRRVFAASEDALLAVLPELEAGDVVAVDVEMGQRVHRRPGGYQEWIHILALIQLAAGTVSVVVDPLRCSVLPLRGLMAGNARKVFLGGGQDAALLEKAGIPARNIVDVGEAAYALFGRREDGMAALARRIFDLSLDKTVRRTDWMARPINPTLLAYAHRDAELTLAIFRWFEREHPEILRFHQRRELETSLPAGAPPWLTLCLERSSPDPIAVVMAQGLDPARDADRLADEMRPYLTETDAPRLLNKLLRLAGDLGLSALTPDILPLAESRSSLLRASAARAIGQIADSEVAEPVLFRLKDDPIEDVRKAATAAEHDLRARTKKQKEEDELVEEDEAPSLGGDALSALLQLKERLESSED
jgi:hypothetical protein